MSTNDSRNHVVASVDELVADMLEGLPRVVPAVRTAEALGISYRTLQRRIGTGQIKAMKTRPGKAGRLLVPRAEIERVLRMMLAS